MDGSTMDNIVTVILAVLASSGLWECVKLLIERYSKKKTPTQEVVLALGRDRLLHLCKQYREMAYIPEEDYETFVAMGDAYILMHGNSKVKKLFEECRKLPIKDN